VHGREQEVLGAKGAVAESPALDVSTRDQPTLPLGQRPSNLARARSAEGWERLFELLAETFERDTGVLQCGDRGVLPFAQDPDHHVSVRDIVVPHRRGECARDRQRHPRARAERCLVLHSVVSHPVVVRHPPSVVAWPPQ
jgi:hypothetical protein